MNKKKRRIYIRASEILFRKLVAISKATGKTKTAVIADLIFAEYDRESKKYSRYYYEDLDKEL